MPEMLNIRFRNGFESLTLELFHAGYRRKFVQELESFTCTRDEWDNHLQRTGEFVIVNDVSKSDAKVSAERFIPIAIKLDLEPPEQFDATGPKSSEETKVKE